MWEAGLSDEEEGEDTYFRYIFSSFQTDIKFELIRISKRGKENPHYIVFIYSETLPIAIFQNNGKMAGDGPALWTATPLSFFKGAAVAIRFYLNIY